MSRIIPEEEIRIDTLPNGLRVATERMPGVESAAIGVWVDVGARSERPVENGVAHFLEHMAFKGTKRRSARAIAEEIESVGGWINAYTGRETTAYLTRLLGEDVPLGFDILGDILRNSTLEPREIERERGVILAEIGESHDTPDDIIFDWLQETCYPDQAMGRPILGTRDTVRTMDQATLRGYLSRHYRPGTMVVAAAGAVDHEAVLRMAEDWFGDMEAIDPETPETARFAGGEKRVSKDLEQAHFALSFPAPGLADLDGVHRSQIFSVAFGGGMSSRLFQEIRENRGLCYSIYAFGSAHIDGGTFTIYSGTDGERIEEMMVTVADELRRAADDLEEVEISRARAQVKAGLLMGRESAMNRAERMGRQILTFGKPMAIAETVERIEAVDAAALRAFAAELAQAPAALALYGPVDAAPGVGALAARLAG